MRANSTRFENIFFHFSPQPQWHFSPQAYAESRNVLLIYSVKVTLTTALRLNSLLEHILQESGKFCGLARLSTESRRDGPKVFFIMNDFDQSAAITLFWTLLWNFYGRFYRFRSIELVLSFTFRFHGFFLPVCLRRPLVGFSISTGYVGKSTPLLVHFCNFLAKPLTWSKPEVP